MEENKVSETEGTTEYTIEDVMSAIMRLEDKESKVFLSTCYSPVQLLEFYNDEEKCNQILESLRQQAFWYQVGIRAVRLLKEELKKNPVELELTSSEKIEKIMELYHELDTDEQTTISDSIKQEAGTEIDIKGFTEAYEKLNPLQKAMIPAAIIIGGLSLIARSVEDM